MKKTICDHCGEKLDAVDEYYSFRVRLSGSIKQDFEKASKLKKIHLQDFDLCEKCTTEFERWIKKSN